MNKAQKLDIVSHNTKLSTYEATEDYKVNNKS